MMCWLGSGAFELVCYLDQAKRPSPPYLFRSDAQLSCMMGDSPHNCGTQRNQPRMRRLVGESRMWEVRKSRTINERKEKRKVWPFDTE